MNTNRDTETSLHQAYSLRSDVNEVLIFRPKRANSIKPKKPTTRISNPKYSLCLNYQLAVLRGYENQ